MRKINLLGTGLFLFFTITLLYIATCTNTAIADYKVPKNPPKAQYKIEFSIDPINGYIGGSENIRFKNTTNHPLECLSIKCQTVTEQNLEITIGGKSVSFSKKNVSGIILIELSEAIIPNEEINIAIKFILPQPIRLNTDILPLTNWYPRLWWGFETHDDFDVKIESPNTYKIVTSGLLNKDTGFFQAKNIRSFGIIILKDIYLLEAKAQDITVKCYYRANEKNCATLLLDTAVDVINFYRERFDFYPNSSLTIIPGQSQPKGGYPIATNIIGIHGMGHMEEQPELHWKWITAHEIGHQYWLEHVLSKDPTQEYSWLMIGLGIYADREYVRAKGLGIDKHQELMERYIQGVRAGNDTTVNISEQDAENIDFDFNNVVIHGKGYSIISSLDCLLGKDVFHKIYLRCLREFGGRRLGALEFQSVCEAESDQDLDWFFKQWLNSNRYLSYEITSKKSEQKGDIYITEIGIKKLGDLNMPIPVKAIFEDGSNQIKFTNRLLDENIVRFESKSALKQVRLDPENALAMIIPPPSSTRQKLSQEIRNLSWTGSGKQALDIFKAAKEAKLTEPHDWLKLGLLLYDGQYYNESLIAWQSVEALSPKDSTESYVAMVWQGHNYDLLNQRDNALKCYKKALECKQKDTWIRHDQYRMIINRQWVKQRLEIPYKRNISK